MPEPGAASRPSSSARSVSAATAPAPALAGSEPLAPDDDHVVGLASAARRRRAGPACRRPPAPRAARAGWSARNSRQLGVPGQRSAVLVRRRRRRCAAAARRRSASDSTSAFWSARSSASAAPGAKRSTSVAPPSSAVGALRGDHQPRAEAAHRLAQRAGRGSAPRRAGRTRAPARPRRGRCRRSPPRGRDARAPARPPAASAPPARESTLPRAERLAEDALERDSPPRSWPTPPTSAHDAAPALREPRGRRVERLLPASRDAACPPSRTSGCVMRSSEAIAW